MVIDKTTGRGCALSIVSKTIAKQLIAEGIIGKAIFRRARPNGYNILCVAKYGEEARVMLQKGDGMAGEPLWAPSFIDGEIWQQAAGKFNVLTELDRNVEKHLLPKMDEYLKNISDTELVCSIRDGRTPGLFRGLPGPCLYSKRLHSPASDAFERRVLAGN